MTFPNPPSQYPYPQQPAAYPPYGYGMPSVMVPSGVKVVSIIGIILGALLSLCAPFAVIGTVVGIQNPEITTVAEDDYESGSLEAALQSANSDPRIRQLNAVSYGFTFITYLMLLICSIGSLRLLSWARTGMFLFVFLETLNTLYGISYFMTLVLPGIKSGMDSSIVNQPGFETALVIGLILVKSIPFIIPLAVLIAFRRPAAIAAFKGIPYNPYAQYPNMPQYPQGYAQWPQYPAQQYPQQQYPPQQWPPNSPR